MKQLFLPFGLMWAMIVALFLPAGGIFLSENYEEYVMNVKKALSVTYQDRQRYIEFAKKYDWNKIFLKLKEILESFDT